MKKYKLYQVKRSDLGWWEMCFDTIEKAQEEIKSLKKIKGNKSVNFSINII